MRVSERGFAVIAVLLMIAVLVTVTLDVNGAARAEITEAILYADGVQLAAMARSGIQGALAVLSDDDRSVDHLNEEWARSEDFSYASAALFEDGYVSLKIDDESGKIPLNSLVKKGGGANEKVAGVLLRLLTLPSFGLTDQEARDIVDAVVDWIDEDDEVTGFGAESSYYQGLRQPYRCKNGPLDSLEELLRVRGVTADLYFGSKDRLGFADLLSIADNGTININTAHPLVLQCLDDGIAEDLAEAMNDYRREAGHDLSRVTWYKDVTGMAFMTIDSDLITIRSSIFRVRSTAYLRSKSASSSAFLKRGDDGRVFILSWKDR
ncbi:MAG: type II secretion system minor pseudopilin GspK [Deltaproteobacteria bacterium]|nr:type II secretion system minor pseudopilin GspK [Deltaproteobacteria bacterium]